MDIIEWRKRIDEIDIQLAILLCERSRCVIEIGKVKRRERLPVYDPLREKEILERVIKNNRGPLGNDALKRLFERIIDESRRVERVVLEDQSDDGSATGDR